MQRWRVARILARRGLQKLWRKFRTALNVSWLALRDPSIGMGPKLLGAGAALVGIAPLEWVPGINPLFAILADPVLVPALLALAWMAVSREHKGRLSRQAARLPTPWHFLALVAAIFVLAAGIDLYLDLTRPGEDALSPVIDPYIEGLLDQG